MIEPALSEADRLTKLSQREHEVFALYLEGHTQKEIGARLCLSVKTVASHKSALMRKLGCPDFVALIKLGIRNGLTSV